MNQPAKERNSFFVEFLMTVESQCPFNTFEEEEEGEGGGRRPEGGASGVQGALEKREKRKDAKRQTRRKNPDDPLNERETENANPWRQMARPCSKHEPLTHTHTQQ